MGACVSKSCLTGQTLPKAADFSLPKEFTVVKELGYGNEGKTFLIQERTPNGSEYFACKVIPRGAGINPEFVLNGLRNQTCLRFVHVVKMLEVLLSRTHLIVKCEYVRGGDLFEYLCRQRTYIKDLLIDEEHARFLFVQLLFGLYHCHEHHVAHRDITLANVLCTRSKNPIIKICDFGLSKSWDMSHEAKSFSAVGTLWFMSPEVIAHFNHQNEEPYDPRKSDIWSLGVILYAMLLGRFPFLNVESSSANGTQSLVTASSSSLSFLLRKIETALQLDPTRLSTEIENMACLSNEVKDLLLSMLTLDANNRIGLHDIIRHPWVQGGFSRTRGQVLASIGPEKGSDEVEEHLFDSHSQLMPGSPADRELKTMVESSTKPGHDNDSLVRWKSPALRFHGDLSEKKLVSLKKEGICKCRLCETNPEENYYSQLSLKIQNT